MLQPVMFQNLLCLSPKAAFDKVAPADLFSAWRPQKLLFRESDPVLLSSKSHFRRGTWLQQRCLLSSRRRQRGFVQLLKTDEKSPRSQAPHGKPFSTDILPWTINGGLLHHGRPPRSSLKRRKVTVSAALFTFQKWPVTPDPCHRQNRLPPLLAAGNSSFLYSGGTNALF